jgi:hypothetical protein
VLVEGEESVSPWWILLALLAIAGAIAGAVLARNRAAARRWTQSVEAALTRSQGIVGGAAAGRVPVTSDASAAATELRTLADSSPDEATRLALVGVAEALETTPLDSVEATAAIERARTVIGRTGAAHR